MEGAVGAEDAGGEVGGGHGSFLCDVGGSLGCGGGHAADLTC